MGFSWMGEMVARLYFCFQYDGETHLPNQGGVDFLLSTSCGETYLPKRRMSATIRTKSFKPTIPFTPMIQQKKLFNSFCVKCRQLLNLNIHIFYLCMTQVKNTAMA